MMVDWSWISDMSWFSLVSTSVSRFESILKLRSIGCVNDADQTGADDRL